MKTEVKTIEITEIYLLSALNEISIRGTLCRNNLCYDTQITINNHQLNVLINELQRLNASADVAGSFERSPDGSGSYFYSLDAEKLANRTIDTAILSMQGYLLEIRA